MQSNALKKQDYLQDNSEAPQESWEKVRLHIVQQVEAACDLPGNLQSQDFEAFITQYSLEAFA